MANSSMFAPTMYGLLHIGSNTRHKRVLVGNQQQAQHPMCIAHVVYCILVPQARKGHRSYQWTLLPKYGAPMIELTPAYGLTAQMTHSTMNHAQPTPHP